MMTELSQTLGKVNNMQETENGATGYSTSGQKLVDLNFRVPSNHNNVTSIDVKAFVSSFKEDPINTVKWLFYLRDVREGLGERDSFISLFNHLYRNNIEVAIKVLPLIPEFGRWKDVVDLLNYVDDNCSLSEAIYSLINKQLREDCQNLVYGKPVSLLAKWLPSVNASSKARKIARRICNHLVLTFADYRKVLSQLRKYIDVTEVKTCGGEWENIDYNKVSSNANSRYVKAFMKHDAERRQKYLDDLKKPESGAVMHASNLYPYEVYSKYSDKLGYRYFNENRKVTADDGIEALWNNLKNIETVGNTMVVVDGSGSMESHIKGSSVRAIDVSRSLGVFFSERCTGEYKDQVIEFSATPQYIDLSGCKTLADKYNTLMQYEDSSNTDLEKVFELILKTAVDNNLPQEELPARLLIVSDMEFDMATQLSVYSYSYNHPDIMSKYQTLFESIKKTWAEYGYTLPNIVFWNVNSRTQTFPVTSNECGITLVSGFSVNNVKMVLSGDIDPWNALKSVLDSERYKVIEDILS